MSAPKLARTLLPLGDVFPGATCDPSSCTTTPPAEAEFFAVVTEAFFGQPRELRAGHPALYEQLRAFYRQDPASR